MRTLLESRSKAKKKIYINSWMLGRLNQGGLEQKAKETGHGWFSRFVTIGFERSVEFEIEGESREDKKVII